MKANNTDEIKSALEVNKKWSDRIALIITDIFGSMLFLTACILVFAGWILWNTATIPGAHPFDKFPFPALEMVVSVFAIILSVSVLISQNRQRKMEKMRQKLEFEVNVRAEKEITKVLQMLHDIQKKMGIDTRDSELEVMKENIDLQELHEKMNNQQD